MSVSSIESSTTSATIDDDLERFSYFTPNLHWEPTYMWARYEVSNREKSPTFDGRRNDISADTICIWSH